MPDIEIGQLARVMRPSKWTRGAVVSAYTMTDPVIHRIIEVGEIVLVTGRSPIGEKVIVMYEGSFYLMNQSLLGCL